MRVRVSRRRRFGDRSVIEPFAFALVAFILAMSLRPDEWQGDLVTVSVASACAAGLLMGVMVSRRRAKETSAKAYLEVSGVDEPLVEWTPAEWLPAEEHDSGEGGAYRSQTREKVVRYVANEKLAAKARRTANIVTTVADEAAIAEERLFVREEADVAFIALADLRDEERDLPKGGTTFVFGRATRIAFLNEDNDVVRALREMLPSSSRADM